MANLSRNDGDFHIYGFNGKHLDWCIKGIVRDDEGNAVGASKNATSIYAVKAVVSCFIKTVIFIPFL